MTRRDGLLPDVQHLSPRRVDTPVSRAQQQIDLEVYEHSLVAWGETTKEQIDTLALAEAVRFAAEEEMTTYDELMLKAGNSRVKQELAIRKINMLSNIDNSRLQRRFG